MLSSLESGLGLDIVIWLQAHNPPPLPALAQVLHHAGGTAVYIALLALILWAVDDRLGVRLLLTLAGSIVLTEGLKALFARPRPFQAFPDRVTPLVAQSGYGLPSGHVLQALAVLGCIAWWLHDRRLTIFVGLYVVVLGWSRMAAGVHYPQDVLVGALVGGLWLWIVIRFGARLATGWNRLALPIQIGAIVLVGLVLLALLGPTESGAPLAGMLIGGGLGLTWEERRVRYSADGNIGQRALRFGLGLGLILIVYLGLRGIFSRLEPEMLWASVRYALLAAAGLALWPWICVRVGLAERRTAI
jgi:hypothetical protein